MDEWRNLKVTPETHRRFDNLKIELNYQRAKKSKRGEDWERMTQDGLVNYLLDEYDRTHIAESIRRSKLKSK